jgi:hypothetical protein
MNLFSLKNYVIIRFEQSSLSFRKKIKKISKFLTPIKLKEDKKYYTVLSNLNVNSYFTINEKIGYQHLESNSLTDECVKDTESRYLNLMKNRKDFISKKPYFQEFCNLTDYSTDSAPFKFATNPSLIKAVANYLGEAPVLWNISAFYSPPSSIEDIENKNFKGSQLWHRDAEDTRNLKIWILCSDISENSGPTVCLSSEVSNKICNEISYKQGTKIENEIILNNYKNEMFSLVGAKGKVYVTDTSECLHMGSRVIEPTGRLVLMVHFISRYSNYFWSISKSKRRFPPFDINTLEDYKKELFYAG